MVPARMSCWPGLKLNLHSKGRSGVLRPEAVCLAATGDSYVNAYN